MMKTWFGCVWKRATSPNCNFTGEMMTNQWMEDGYPVFRQVLERSSSGNIHPSFQDGWVFINPSQKILLIILPPFYLGVQAQRLTPSPEWRSPRAGRWSYPAWSWWRADRRWSRTTPGRTDPWGKWRWWSGQGSPHKPGPFLLRFSRGFLGPKGTKIGKLLLHKSQHFLFDWMQVFIHVFTIWDWWSFSWKYSDKPW